MLKTNGGLKNSKYLLVDEQVVIFLHILAHDIKKIDSFSLNSCNLDR